MVQFLNRGIHYVFRWQLGRRELTLRHRRPIMGMVLWFPNVAYGTVHTATRNDYVSPELEVGCGIPCPLYIVFPDSFHL